MDKYEQHELLGHGNSSVYRAICLSDGLNVALKRVKGWSALEAEDQRVGLSEVAVLKTVEHPHAIKLLDSFTDKGDLCMVLPLVRPGTRVFEGSALPLTPAAVARVGYQLASALAYLHSKTPQLLHRDIKPANLLLVAAPGVALPPPGPLTPAQASALVCSGTLLLSDFGSALMLSKTQATATRSGTDAYKSPEVLDLEDYDASADVWACGATLLQLATGHLAGGTLAARRSLKRGDWTQAKALGGDFHDKFTCAEEEEEWDTACATQRTAWAALGEPLQQLIESCLVVEAGGRAKASELLGHAAFVKERRGALVAGAVGKLAGGGGGVGGGGGGGGVGVKALTREELLAVLEVGEGVEEGCVGARVSKWGGWQQRGGWRKRGSRQCVRRWWGA